ncbi:MAG: CvpA family protein [Sedimentisphaerales bacterium]|nr:CvpA family protein [Sedimentisphaerales bacterium]
MSSLLVLVIIVGCVAYQYIKGTLVKAFATIMAVICSSVVAFGYFEALANVFISRGQSSRNAGLVPWAPALCFALLFVVAFAILQTAIAQIVREKIDLGVIAERAGRIVCGALLGLIASGLVLTALAMAPLSNNIPYERFDKLNPNPDLPGKSLLNADGFAVGWFSTISRGSFSGRNSFAVLRADFLDQLFLNKLNSSDDVPIVTTSQAITVSKESLWPAPEGLRISADPNRVIEPKSGCELTIVRIGIKRSALPAVEKFTLGQVRVVCKLKTQRADVFSGNGVDVYPAGYVGTPGKIQLAKLSHIIKLSSQDFDGSVKWIDFIFYVPNEVVPVVAEFKQNNVAELAAPLSPDKAPELIPFIKPAKPTEPVESSSQSQADSQGGP